VRVEGYDLSLSIDPPARRFRGTVVVRLSTDEPWIRLNAVELTFGIATVDGTVVEPQSNPGAQEVVLPAGTAGEHTARLDFSGAVLPDGLIGMYVSPFGSGREILTTQMYPTGARRLFPCLDVPAAKAEFRVSVRVPKGHRVIFNTDPVEEQADGEATRVQFAPTPRMSTYLLYLGVGPFEESERTDGNLRVIVGHPAGRGASAQFALDHASRYLREYESYYAIPYPLPKLHLIAVPSFWAGAMENWGAITFRETTLLVDERTNAAARRWNRQVLCHEIAHQWFGNLVTNAWWNDFWLNEAFATFVAGRIVDRVHPGESTWSDFVQYEAGRGFSQDVLDTAHPIEVEIKAPEEIGEIADGITYGKGASILRMIESFLGEAAFRAGVTAYLREHSYATATGADLWSSLDRHSGQPVSRIMREWVQRPGHPMVEVRREGSAMVVTQRRFRFSGKKEPSDWPIPLSIEIDGTVHRTILEGGEYRLAAPPGARLRVNPDRTGFFHTRYDGELAEEIARRWPELSEIDQWGLLFDRGLFLASGDGSLDQFLAVVAHAAASTTYLPVLTAARQLRAYGPFLEKVPELAAAHREFYRSQLRRLGLTRSPGEPESTGVLREALGYGLLDSVPEVVHQLAHGFSVSEGSIDRDLLDAATIAYVKTGGAEAWDTVRNRIPSATSDEEASRLATGLPYTSDPDRFGRTLALLEGPEFAASRIWDILADSRFNTQFSDRLWGWYERQLPALAERWKGTPLLSALLPETLAWCGLGRGDAVRSYFADHRFPEAERGVREGLERLAIRERLAVRLGAMP
jgi:tricorn protease interacting factor F2/3